LVSLNKMWQGRFQNPAAGRKRVHYFREAGASYIPAGALLHLKHDAATLKRTYDLTAEATGGVTRMEGDPPSVLVTFPDMWVIAKR
jgi:hypothetical protein